MYNSLEKFFELVENKTENNRWDYKREIHLNPNNSFANLLKDILAFANSGGGWLVLGVDDEGNISGIGHNKIDPTSLSEKIMSTINQQIVFELNYYDLEVDKVVGLLYIYDSEEILVSPKNLNDEKNKAIVSENTIYYRRNASSTKANMDDLNLLIYKVSRLGKYEFKSEDLRLLNNKKSEYSKFKQEDQFYKGEFKFSVSGFAEKLNNIFNLHQSDYTKYEMGILLGLEVSAIDDYFEGKRFPKLEYLLRAVEIFDLPHDYFFQTTIGMEKPFIQNPLITFAILQKTENKSELFNYGFSNAFQKIFNDTAKNFSVFKKWLYCDDRESLKPKSNEWESLFHLNVRMYEEYEKYLEDISEELYFKFKEHLKAQYYKEIERTPDIDERFLNEAIYTSLISSDNDFVCKFISELIKTIDVVDDKLTIEYNFLYEVQNKIARFRSYDSEQMKVQFESQKNLDELL
ncbi:ATP-binding protein [Saccharibacillus sacchari]|uniref:ATP-binding protein n=1 Tax=Saccharibacillus sacchari TaxID=456493 RepID=UPI0004B6FAA6|nr:ATP-binding protein [Saccharibacillus sacchari]